MLLCALYLRNVYRLFLKRDDAVVAFAYRHTVIEKNVGKNYGHEARTRAGTGLSGE